MTQHIFCTVSPFGGKFNRISSHKNLIQSKITMKQSTSPPHQGTKKMFRKEKDIHTHTVTRTHSIRIRYNGDKRLTNPNVIRMMPGVRKTKSWIKTDEVVDMPNDVLFLPFSFHLVCLSVCVSGWLADCSESIAILWTNIVRMRHIGLLNVITSKSVHSVFAALWWTHSYFDR